MVEQALAPLPIRLDLIGGGWGSADSPQNEPRGLSFVVVICYVPQINIFPKL